MQINEKQMTPMDLLRLAFIGTAIEPQLRAFEADMGLEADSVPAKLAEAHRAAITPETPVVASF